jgi:hypothetical protein
MRLVLLALLLTACAPYKPFVPYIDPSAEPFVKEFEEIYHTEVLVNVYVTELPVNIGGECIESENRTIELNKPYWEAISYFGKEQLLFHELGHCVLNRGHRNDLGQVGIYFNVPMSIMYYMAFGETAYYQANRTYYLQELGR